MRHIGRRRISRSNPAFLSVATARASDFARDKPPHEVSVSSSSTAQTPAQFPGQDLSVLSAGWSLIEGSIQTPELAALSREVTRAASLSVEDFEFWSVVSKGYGWGEIEIEGDPYLLGELAPSLPPSPRDRRSRQHQPISFHSEDFGLDRSGPLRPIWTRSEEIMESSHFDPPENLPDPSQTALAFVKAGPREVSLPSTWSSSFDHPSHGGPSSSILAGSIERNPLDVALEDFARIPRALNHPALLQQLLVEYFSDESFVGDRRREVLNRLIQCGLVVNYPLLRATVYAVFHRHSRHTSKTFKFRAPKAAAEIDSIIEQYQESGLVLHIEEQLELLTVIERRFLIRGHKKEAEVYTNRILTLTDAPSVSVKIPLRAAKFSQTALRDLIALARELSDGGRRPVDFAVVRSLVKALPVTVTREGLEAMREYIVDLTVTPAKKRLWDEILLRALESQPGPRGVALVAQMYDELGLINARLADEIGFEGGLLQPPCPETRPSLPIPLQEAPKSA